MPKKMSRWGIGPLIAVSAIFYAVIAGIITSWMPGVFVISVIPYSVFLPLGIVLLGVGIPMLVISARAMTIAYNRDRLTTDGIFGVVRNPIYSAWIVFILPGVMMLCHSWLMLLTPVVAYIAFKSLITRENRYLAERFGQEYEEYRAKVNEIMPGRKFWARKK